MAHKLDIESLTKTVRRVAEIAEHSRFAPWVKDHLPENLRPMLHGVKDALSPSSAVGEALAHALGDTTRTR